MNRLDFLRKGVTAAAGTLMTTIGLSGVLGTMLASAGELPPKSKTIGLQLYSLRDSMYTNVKSTLQEASRMGYTSLETVGYDNGKLYGMTPQEFRAICEELGMKVTSAHLGRSWDPAKESEIMEWWNTALDAQKEVGCKYVIQPSFPIGKTIPEIQAYCDYFNKVGKMAKDKGLQFGFHNHAGEFATIDDKVILEYMIENTDPELVTYELDVYWAQQGGVDPAEFIDKYAKRIGVLHIKDDSIIGESGTMDFEKIFAAASKNNIKDYYVEVERYTMPPINCVERSCEFLKVSEFVK